MRMILCLYNSLYPLQSKQFILSMTHSFHMLKKRNRIKLTSAGKNCSVKEKVTNSTIWDPNTKHLGN